TSTISTLSLHDALPILKFFGGLAQTTQNVLPPNYPEYQKINFYTYNLAKAKQLVKQSGTAGQKVTVYGVNTDPSKSVTEYDGSRSEEHTSELQSRGHLV